LGAWDSISLPVQQLLTVYAVTFVSMGLALIIRRAAWHQYLSWPVLAAVVAVVTAMIWSVFVNYVLHGSPSSSSHASLLYAAFVALFGLSGVCAGVLVTGRSANTTIKRGTEILEGGLSRIRSRPVFRRGVITLAHIELDPQDETKHFKLIGTTGTGKSTAIREILETALGRGDRAIIADPDGGFLDRFYDTQAGDVILNPFDNRSRRWDFFAEIEHDYDAEQLARALIPESNEPDRSWRDYARTLVAAIAKQLSELKPADRQYASVEELHRLIQRAPIEELKILLENTAAHAFLERGNERMFGSIRSVASQCIASLEYIAKQEPSVTPISIRQWVRGEAKSSRALFLPYSASQTAALGSAISAWMRIAIFECMSGVERNQRLWFIIDELDALGRIDGLKDALARLRKFGGRCVLGFQSIAQVSDTYGHGEAQTIVENCGNTLILRCSASEQGGTARFASKLIGDREIIRPHETRSRRPGEWRYARTYTEQHVTEAAVLPSEIEQLPDLSGYVKLASTSSWHKVTLRRQ
jgi:type IV secretory pathway TraG/TraD family ATPase VirD4